MSDEAEARAVAGGRVETPVAEQDTHEQQDRALAHEPGRERDTGDVTQDRDDEEL